MIRRKKLIHLLYFDKIHLDHVTSPTNQVEVILSRLREKHISLE